VGMEIDRDTLLKFYVTMLKIRLFEERVIDLYARGFVPGLAHLYIGEEAVATGVCAALREDDYITSTHRGHGHVIAKGARLKSMMAELFGKRTGCCKGKGGSMHIADMAIGVLGANGIAGGGLPIAVGAGMSAKWRGTDQVTVSFFGDDASNSGTFHESLNLASLYTLPVVFVCEDNLYGISVGQKQQRLLQDIALRATSYSMPGVTVDGNDVIKVYGAASDAVERARAGGGPSLIECKTYRWRGHHEGDPNRGRRYRTEEEIESWKERDPIERLVTKLISDEIVTGREVEVIKEGILEEIEQAVAFAEESPFPALEDLYEGVYVQEGGKK